MTTQPTLVFTLRRQAASSLSACVDPTLRDVVDQHGHQKALPIIARTSDLASTAELGATHVATTHRGFLGDSRSLEVLDDHTIDLIVTSPPYWNLKPYEAGPGQLGLIDEFDDFLDALDDVWRHCYRSLIPGGRLVIVTGDVLVPRRRYGRHIVFPLHAAIQERARRLGFDNLAPIIWHKIGNAALEADNGGRFLGKPYEPNAIIKNDVEYILFQRKPGGYRSPSLEARLLSVIPANRHAEWFQQIWRLGGASTRHHPAPFPLALAERIIRMFSFVGDTVLDPFLGSGTTTIAASRWGRNSVGFEVEPAYLADAEARIRQEFTSLQPHLWGRTASA